MPKSLTLYEKLDYIEKSLRSHANNREAIISDDLTNEYLYQVVNSLTKRILKNNILAGYQIKDDIVHGVLLQFLTRNLNPRNRLDDFTISIAYIEACIRSKISIFLRAEKSNSFINLLDTEDFKFLASELEYETLYSDLESQIQIESSCKFLIKKVSDMIMSTPIQVKHKNLLVFPVLRCLSTKNHNILRKYPLRVRSALKEIIYEIGEPYEYLEL